MGLKSELGTRLENAFGNLSSSMYNASNTLLNIQQKRDEDAEAEAKTVKDAYNSSTLQQLLAYQDSIYFNFDPQNPDNEGYVQKLSRTYNQAEYDALEATTLQMMYDKMDELQVDPEVKKLWEEKYMPDFRYNLNKAKQDAYTQNYAVKTANLWQAFVNSTGANSDLDYAAKEQALRAYWSTNSLDTIKQYVSGLTSLDDAIDAMQQASVTQYVDRYYATTPNPQAPVSQIASEAVEALKDQLGKDKALDSDTEFALQAAALKQAQAHEDTIVAQAKESQNKIVADFRTMQLNGEWDGDPDDVIQAAVEAGAIVNGQIDRNWVSFLAPYLDKSDENRAIAEATAQINAEVNAAASVTPQQIKTTAAAVSNGTFTFVPDTVHEGNVPKTTTTASGAQVPLSTDRSYGAPVLNTENGEEGTGIQVTEKVEVTPQGEVVVEDEVVPATVFENDQGTVYVISDEPIEELNDYVVSTPEENSQEIIDEINAEIGTSAEETPETPSAAEKPRAGRFTTSEETRAERIAAAEAEIRKNHALDRNYEFDTESLNSPVRAEYLQEKYDLTEREAEQYADALNDKTEEVPEPHEFSHPVSIGPSSYVYVVAEDDRPPYDADYTPYEGSEETQLSDIALAAQELAEMVEDTDFPNMFNEEGDINYDNSRGKYTYKYNGLPDITTNYAPVVMALCQSCGITYDTDSYAVYVMAQNVYEMEMAGAFTNPNKALAVQALSVKRLDPNVTPEEYNAQVMQYKTTGILTDDEIKAYDLENHAFAGDLSQNSSYNESLKHAYNKAFTALFKKSYTTENINNINADSKKADQWFQMQRDLEKELTLAYQLDPTGVTKDPLKTINEIVTRLTDESFSKDLLEAVLDSHSTFGTWLTSTSNRVQMGDNATVSDLMQDYFIDPGKYADYYDSEIMEAVNDRYYGPSLNNANYGIERSNANAQIKELAKDFFGKDYKELTIPEKNKLLFSYAYARTRIELTRATCMTFGYSLDEVYGNVTVASSGGIGGGMAVVTKDGRVYMSGEAPNGGHNWLIGSVSQRTLENIQKGATTVSYAEISTYGVKTFNDQNYTFDKSGASLTRQATIADTLYGGSMGLIDLRGNQEQKDKDKEIELVDIYDAVQPERYNIIDLNKGVRSN